MPVSLVLILMILFGLMTACTPEMNYKVLSFFFDGVPDFTKKETATKKDTTSLVKNGNHSMAEKQNTNGFTYNHTPFTDRKCTACHDKEMSGTLLKPQPASCYACHPDFSTRFKYLHGPTGGGYCTNCHAAHRAKNDKLLIRTGNQICLPCHVKEEVLKNKVHASIGNSECTQCHDPHGGSNRFVLK